MAIILEKQSPACVDMFPSAAQAALFRSRNSGVIELAPGNGVFSDAYADNPFLAPRLKAYYSGLIYDSGNNRIWGYGSGTNITAHTLYDKLGQIADVTITGKLIHAAGNNCMKLTARVNASTGAHYQVWFYGGDLYLQYYSAWDTYSSTLGTQAGFSYNTLYNVKFYLVETAIKVKAWTGAEPGWGIEVTNATLATGYLGVAGRSVSSSYYIDDYSADPAGFSTASPVYYAKYDSGQNGTAWATELIKILTNLMSGDSGTVNVKFAYSNTSWAQGDEASIDAALSASWLTPDGSNEVTAPAGTGRYRYIAYQFVSDGTQQTSVALMEDDAQTVTISTSSADARGVLSDAMPYIGETLTVTGTVEAGSAFSADLDIEVRRTSDDGLVDTLFSGNVALSAGSNDIPTLCGAAVQWDTTGQTAQGYYVRIDIDSGALDRDDMPFQLVPAGGHLFGRYRRH